ncbi:dicarboxylic acid transporter [Multifurca ochricompacta]|uniref:Dicarboxylic acid transporter n=1 Tax=Multifurca ochricompacta TaxID=376703 RepID=A0AAD4QN71_9AGAM|nr:dicarboxylic acid transporter [Multifurca ochricompacta]
MSAPIKDAAPSLPIGEKITAKPKKQPYPFWLGGRYLSNTLRDNSGHANDIHPFHSLGVAATIAASITHPLDLTKVRLQASGDKRMIESIKKTVRTAGVRGLFDGITGTWMRQMSYSLCRFWAYDESKKMIGAGANSPAWKLAVAGSMAGGIAGFVGNPAEIVMVRLQGDFAKAPEKRFNYKHCFDALFRMVREEGVSSLGRGMTPNIFRAVLMNASQLASYDFFKAELLKTSFFEDNIYCHFTASFAAGTVATTVCSPADVLKSRIMNASGPGSASTLGVIRHSMQTEGPAFMFKGWLPAWSRLQPTTILIFLTLEQLKNLVDWSRARGIAL